MLKMMSLAIAMSCAITLWVELLEVTSLRVLLPCLLSPEATSKIVVCLFVQGNDYTAACWPFGAGSVVVYAALTQVPH